jgi:hypothetical protein
MFFEYQLFTRNLNFMKYLLNELCKDDDGISDLSQIFFFLDEFDSVFSE